MTTNKQKTLGLAPKSESKEVTLPEDELISLGDVELKEQFGHMTTQLLHANKVEQHLRQVIKDLRKELDNGS